MINHKELRHRVTVRSGRTGLGLTSTDRTVIRHGVYKALLLESIGTACEINVLVTDEDGIRRLNSEFRELDKPTDVLSFPMFDLMPGQFFPEQEAPDGFFPLGDIALCLPRALQQAKEYGHTLSRELGFLTVHGTLHLLGYDHETPEQEREMQRRTEDVLAALGLTRTGEV